MMEKMNNCNNPLMIMPNSLRQELILYIYLNFIHLEGPNNIVLYCFKYDSARFIL